MNRSPSAHDGSPSLLDRSRAGSDRPRAAAHRPAAAGESSCAAGDRPWRTSRLALSIHHFSAASEPPREPRHECRGRRVGESPPAGGLMASRETRNETRGEDAPCDRWPARRMAGFSSLSCPGIHAGARDSMRGVTNAQGASPCPLTWLIVLGPIWPRDFFFPPDDCRIDESSRRLATTSARALESRLWSS